MRSFPGFPLWIPSLFSLPLWLSSQSPDIVRCLLTIAHSLLLIDYRP